MNHFIDVILPLPLPDCFTYRVSEEFLPALAIGKRVLAPFGKNKFYSALVLRQHSQQPQGYEVKDIISVLDEYPIVTQRQLTFWQWLADYYLCTLGEVMAAGLPAAFKLASETKIGLHPDFSGEISSLSEKEMQVINALVNRESLTLAEIEKMLNRTYVISQIKNLLDKEVVTVFEEVEERYFPKTEIFLSLAEEYQNEAAFSQLLNQLEQSKRTQSQADILLLFWSVLQKHKTNHIAKSHFLKYEQVSNARLSSLVKKGFLLEDYLEISRLSSFCKTSSPHEIVLSPHQQQALSSIKQEFEAKDKVLLHGVTGSGKTEIYIKLMQEVIESGKQVLYLLPEITLTTQIINRLRNYFGDDVGVYHSRFSDLERVEIWNTVLGKTQHQYKIILGARSAIFLPFSNLGLIIVDEEHDYSYKQFDPTPRYNARDAAVILAGIHQGKVLFGTATPSMETYFNAQQGKYSLVALHQRYGGMQLPKLQLIDMKKERQSGQVHSHYSQSLLSAIETSLSKGEQVILFQNRRGFSLHLECGLCRFVPSCKNCDVSLTYHKQRNALRCHYCGYTEKMLEHCPQCKAPILKMYGFGTEKVEEEMQFFFPNARIARLDYDSTRTKNAFQRILSDFETRKMDILIGTQMITKGLDFENVGLVGILNADNTLNYPDFRSIERGFQLMMQVSGRAGRKNNEGTVLIQTYNSDNEVFTYLKDNNYPTFFERLIGERRQFSYPPFTRLIRISIKHKELNKVNQASACLGNMLRNHFGKIVLGPEFPLIIRIKNLYQKDILIKLPINKELTRNKKLILAEIRRLQSNPLYRSAKVVADVDAY
jgi:primosomal protein N' (replication factor Y)